MASKKPHLVFVFAAFLALAGPTSAAAKGKVEFGFHYGPWTLNVLRGVFEGLAEDFAENLKDDMFKDLQDEYPDREIREKEFRNVVHFDSGGKNFGFEVRWYPGGEDGSFSLGLAVEKSTLRVGPLEVDTAIAFEDAKTHETAQFAGKGTSQVTAEPLAAVLSFRWDIFPRGVVHPYFTFGFGIAGGSALDKTKIEYDFTGSASFPGEPTEVIEESGSKTLLQLKEESLEPPEEGEGEKEPFEYPGFFPIFQLHFGLKAKLSSNIHLLVDAGLFNGFLLRGGIAIRI
ncbi:MAG: hypothetical protein FJY80_05960 [Candidatus Aminicenantes bacterium]|nr:hypothetical protein [Candidatus Aminicenantes bacterium]